MADTPVYDAYDCEVEDIAHTKMQLLYDLLNRRVPRDEGSWQKLKTVFRLAEKQDAALLLF